MEELTEQKCVACRVGAPSVTEDEVKELHPQVPDWQIINEDNIPKLDRLYKFKNFKDAIAFHRCRRRRRRRGRASPASYHRVGQSRRHLVDAQDQEPA